MEKMALGARAAALQEGVRLALSSSSGGGSVGAELAPEPGGGNVVTELLVESVRLVSSLSSTSSSLSCRAGSSGTCGGRTMT